MNRRWLATRLAIILAASGLLPILGLGAMGVRLLRQRAEMAAQESLRALAEQASERVRVYVGLQRETLRMIANNLATDQQAATRLEEIRLDAPSLGPVRMLVAPVAPEQRPPMMSAEQIQKAADGTEVASPTYLGKDLTPSMDVCLPARGEVHAAICTSLDLLELQRLVQRIHIGEQGFAVALDPSGRLLAAGAPQLRAAVLTSERTTESELVERAGRKGVLPGVFVGGLGVTVVAGWARLDDLDWIVVVEQPTSEALAAANQARHFFYYALLTALLASLTVGIWQSRRVLGWLEREERWRTAGRIAAGIAHDMGHRLAILQQTQSLAETVVLTEPQHASKGYLELISENLKSEVSTLRKFVADFADLSREVNREEFVPLNLSLFAGGLSATTQPQADLARVRLDVVVAEGPAAWALCDRYLLERAALNLITNAIEASPAGATITVRVRADLEKRLALLEVQDQGPGIAPERQQNIFDAFASTKRTGAHVGLGLPNVQRIARAHGGEVFLESELGQGCLFTLVLPLVEPSA